MATLFDLVHLSQCMSDLRPQDTDIPRALFDTFRHVKYTRNSIYLTFVTKDEGG